MSMAAGNSNGESRNIEQRISSALCKISESEFEIIFYHKIDFNY